MSVPMTLNATRNGNNVVVTGIRNTGGATADVLLELGVLDDGGGFALVKPHRFLKQDVPLNTSTSHTFQNVNDSSVTHCQASDPNDPNNFDVVAIQ